MKREEAEGEEEEEEIGKMVDILHVEESRTGQRSRRSSGYASASNSPSMLAKKAVAVIDDDLEKYRTSLYEVTLRWMFDAEPQSWVIIASIFISGSSSNKILLIKSKFSVKKKKKRPSDYLST